MSILNAEGLDCTMSYLPWDLRDVVVITIDNVLILEGQGHSREQEQQKHLCLFAFNWMCKLWQSLAIYILDLSLIINTTLNN